MLLASNAEELSARVLATASAAPQVRAPEPIFAEVWARFSASGRLPESVDTHEVAAEIALHVWLGNYQSALDLCKRSDNSSLRAALEGLLSALPNAERASMTFFPQRCRQDVVSRHPSSKIRLERATYTATDGTKIGWVYAASTMASSGKQHPVLLLRWGGNAELAAQVCPGSPYEDLVAKGLVMLVLVDYRGFGWSEGSPSLRVLRSDAEDLYNSLPTLLAAHDSQWTDSSPLIIMGRSLGAHCALHLAALRSEQLSGLVLDSPCACHWPLEQVPADCWRALSSSLQAAGVPPLNSVRQKPMHCTCCRGPKPSLAQAAREASWLDPLDIVSVTKTPLLLLSGTADELCPRPQIEELFRRSAAPQKEMVWLEGLGHNEVSSSPTYWRALTRFLQNTSRLPSMDAKS